jgi:hypothetical protein
MARIGVTCALVLLACLHAVAQEEGDTPSAGGSRRGQVCGASRARACFLALSLALSLARALALSALKPAQLHAAVTTELSSLTAFMLTWRSVVQIVTCSG